jgi:hypothetical protein
MRKLEMALIATTAILFGGALAWQAEAAPWSGAAKLGAAAKIASPVEVVACNGRWGRCPPGRFWARGACRIC